jgi:phage shock protein PspC (stress-responsive transcriptional regulator)
MTTTSDNVPLPLRSYTLLGVCEAIGEDFNFNANYIRVPLAAIVVFNIWAAVGAYLALGLLVLASRLLFPVRKAELASNAAGPVPANRNVEEKLAA